MEKKNKDTAFWIFSAVLWLCAIAIWVVAVDRDLPNYGMHGEFDRNDESRRICRSTISGMTFWMPGRTGIWMRIPKEIRS